METSNSELIAELQEQRRHINRKIKELRNAGEATVGSVRVSKQNNPGGKWTLSYEVPHARSYRMKNATQFRTLFFGDTRDECVNAVPGIIDDLQEFYEQVTNEQKGGDVNET